MRLKVAFDLHLPLHAHMCAYPYESLGDSIKIDYLKAETKVYPAYFCIFCCAACVLVTQFIAGPLSFFSTLFLYFLGLFIYSFAYYRLYLLISGYV